MKSRPALAFVLAAHGSRDESDVNERIRAIAAEAGRRGGFAEHSAAFHTGDPPFSEVLDRLTAEHVLVVPFMASQGYYAEVVLPRELACNERLDSVAITLAPAIGAHPGIVRLMERRADETMMEHRLEPRSTTLALIGHGTPRHPRSRDTTFAAAEAIAEQRMVAEVVCAFLDDEPPLETLLARVRTPALIVEPFFISDARHAARDLPRRLGLDAAPATDPPFVCKSTDRLAICHAAVGTDKRIVDVILEACRDAIREVPSVSP